MKNQKVSKDVFENIIIAVCLMIYFILINFAYYHLPMDNILQILKVLSMLFLVVGIIFLEIAYRFESGKIAINSIEILILALHTLSTVHIVELQKFEFANYILVSSYAFSIYFLFKSIIIYTKEKKDYLKSLSDIEQIVSNEPIKKEAVKRGERK